jgi:hypothetical protein
MEDWPVCHDCMAEHCCQTNCLACGYGEYPGCRFSALKRHYMEGGAAPVFKDIGVWRNTKTARAGEILCQGKMRRNVLVGDIPSVKRAMEKPEPITGLDEEARSGQSRY